MHKLGATWTEERIQRGQFAEKLAMELLMHHRCSFQKASSHDDKMLHIDVRFNTPSGIRSADVKSIKGGNDHQFFVEVINSYGLAGWLYGHADQIWFERFESFLLVKRIMLVRLYEERLPSINPEPVTVPTIWRFYQRHITHSSGKKNKDKTILVPLADLRPISHEISKTPEQIKETKKFYDEQRQEWIHQQEQQLKAA